MAKKILVVDDDPLIVQLLAPKLNAAGFEVCSALNGEEALARARHEKPHLIIMDVLMPLMSGYEAMQILRQDPETRDIPAIIISSRGGMKDFFEGIGNIEFLPKPLESKALISRIEVLIGGVQPAVAAPRHVVLAGVEDLLVNKLRDLLKKFGFQVLTALHEDDAIRLVKSSHPETVLCQFWEDPNIFDPIKIAQGVRVSPDVAQTPFYVYCKEPLTMEAMKYFNAEQILAYKESSELLRKLEALLKNPAV